MRGALDYVSIHQPAYVAQQSLDAFEKKQRSSDCWLQQQASASCRRARTRIHHGQVCCHIQRPSLIGSSRLLAVHGAELS